MDIIFYFLINIFCLMACFIIPLIFPIKIRHMLLLFLGAVSTNILHLLFNLEWHTFFTIGVLVLILFLCSERKAVNILCALATYMLAIVLNHLLVMLMSILMNVTTDKIVTDFQVLFMVLFLALLVITAFALRLFFKWLYDKYLNDLPDKIYIFLLIEIISCVGVYILNLTITHNYQHSKTVMTASTVLYATLFVISSLLLILVTRTIKKDTILKDQLLQYEAMQVYMEQIEQACAEYRTFKHDHLNMLLSMTQYIESKDIQGLKTYFYNSILPASQAMTVSDKQLDCLSAIKIPAIKSILSRKAAYALSQGLCIHIHIPAPVTQVSVDDFDLSRILGIFLDNAIEAAMGTQEKQLNISVLCLTDQTVWQLDNSCDSQTIRLDKIKKSGYSTKGPNRGIGLYSASRIIDKYANVKWDIKVKDNRFCQILTINRRCQ